MAYELDGDYVSDLARTDSTSNSLPENKDMRPWERRLRDLAQLLLNCGATYFAPDRFRQNTNQFLQTSRTVTFIIQKNKSEIPEFDDWYKNNVLSPWSDDPIMTWAKNARNVIEKEGDLDMQSTLRASVLYSHIATEDMVVDTTRAELLQADVDKLVRLAKSKLPPGIADAAVLKIERRWIANSLPDRELVYSLTYAYARLYQICTALAAHLGDQLDTTVPHPTTMDPSGNDVSRTRFIKFGKSGVGRNSSIRIAADPRFQPPPAFLKLKAELDASPKPSTLAQIVEVHAKLARVTFEHHGNHVPMLALYDKNWNQIDFMSTAFSDQAEKFLFWRNVADRATYLKAFALVWTSESWLRDLTGHQSHPIGDLPIVGEQLHVVGADVSGSQEVVVWNIIRPKGNTRPVLEPLQPEDVSRQPGNIFFIKPVVAAMKAVHVGNAG